MTRPACENERNATYDYTCHHDHCPTCGAHPVHVSRTESVYQCQLSGEACVPPLEGFA